MEVSLLAQLAAEGPDLGHAIAFREAHRAKQCLAAPAQPRCEDFATGCNQAQAKIAGAIAKAQPALDQLTQVGRIGIEDAHLR